MPRDSIHLSRCALSSLSTLFADLSLVVK